MAKRIQMSRKVAWRAQNPNAVKVDRSTRHGNPFRIGHSVALSWMAGGREQTGHIAAEDASQAVAYFRDWMNGVVDVVGRDRPPVWPLAAYDLACWCALDQPCHADVLLELANTEGDRHGRE